MGSSLVHLIVGARPNFVKAAPLMRSLNSRLRNSTLELVHTGQHYDYEMSRVFFEQFRIPEPEFHLGVGSAPHGARAGRILEELERLFMSRRPEMVIVLGDVNSTLAAALAAVKLRIPVAHVEAGLRSFDMAMPEEVNRILTDRISDMLFVTERAGVENLLGEGMPDERIYLVGNVMIDLLRSMADDVSRSTVLSELGLSPGTYSVLTLHRPQNVDGPEGLRRAADIIGRISGRLGMVFPVHPRTAASIERNGMENIFSSIKGLHRTGPMGYGDFMKLVGNSRFVMTDSGGIQSEAAYLGVPCITLRETTEHLITLEAGINSLTGMDPDRVERAVEDALSFDPSDYTVPGLLDGRASERIADIVADKIGSD